MFDVKLPSYAFVGFILVVFLSLTACSVEVNDTAAHPETENRNSDTGHIMDFGIEKHDTDGMIYYAWSKQPSQFTDLGHGELKMIESGNAICLTDSQSGQNYGIELPEEANSTNDLFSFENGASWSVGETAEQHNFFVKEPRLYNISESMKKSQQEIIKACKMDNQRIFFLIPGL